MSIRFWPFVVTDERQLAGNPAPWSQPHHGNHFGAPVAQSQQRLQAPGLHDSAAFAKSLSGLGCKSQQSGTLRGVVGAA